MDRFSSAEALVRALNPQDPVTCLRPAAAHMAARRFLTQFPGETLYAVKTNPDTVILDALYEAGIGRFDVASPGEIELIAKRYEDAQICFMHPTKNRAAISAAYGDLGINCFAFDSETELNKILSATGNARKLTLLLRLAVPDHDAVLRLNGKFGIAPDDAIPLLVRARSHAAHLGVCFHVGSQCLAPTAYGTALRLVDDLIRKAGVLLDIVDVGGGFPIVYPGQTPPPLENYFGEIECALASLPIGDQVEIWCEPGRALVAEAGSTIVHVDARKEDRLYINDGTYGGLFDAGVPGFRFPVRCLRSDTSAELIPFSFYGPTCDSLDAMAGPFMLPSDIDEGDHIEIGLTGAYSAALRGRFNGFDRTERVILTDAPMTCVEETNDRSAPLKAG
ncbi:MAG: decarboxylase [Rhodospirillaceae bacterium]|nr:decarboxylase [Rhodospirillaceae bacterium]